MSLARYLFAAWCAAAVVAAAAGAAAAERAARVDAARVAEVAAMLPPSPVGVGRPIADRKAWEAVGRSPEFRALIGRADKLLKQPVEQLPDELYLDFSRTGNRDRYQHVLGRRNSRFSVLVLAECLENRGRFLPAIEETLRAILADKSWTLPAHDRALTVFKGTGMEIDLNAAATGANLATAAYWLGDKLGAEVRTSLGKELQRRIFLPFEGMVTRGKPPRAWLTVTNNWNAVCLAGVTIAGTSAIEDPKRRAFVVAAAEQYIRFFLDGFTEDGYCSEGLGYWNYGFGHFMLLAESLLQATGGKIDLWTRPKVAEIARFGRRLEILPGVYPAFADCHVESRPDTLIEAYVSRRFGWGWKDAESKGLLLASGPSLSLFEFGLLGFENSASRRPAAATTAERPLRDWFQQAGILICRPVGSSAETMGAALKGGHNAEHHNHNDVGSFVVALAGQTPILDPGSEVYTRRTFSGQRYESKVLNSYGHPVPRVAGKLQQTGREAQARVVQSEFTDRADKLVLDLRSAYPVPGLKILQRTFVFSREGSGRLEVLDEVEFDRPQDFETALITLSTAKIERPDRIIVGEGRGAVCVEITASGGGLKTTSETIREDLPGKRIPTRLAIALDAPAQRATIRMVIAPAREAGAKAK